MLPILVTQFSQAGLGLIDTIMAGHLSATDLAAIAVGVGLWIPVMLLFSGIMIATTPLVAEANGARTPEKIATIARQSLWVALILGIITNLRCTGKLAAQSRFIPACNWFWYAGSDYVCRFTWLFRSDWSSTSGDRHQPIGTGIAGSTELCIYVWNWPCSSLG